MQLLSMMGAYRKHSHLFPGTSIYFSKQNPNSFTDLSCETKKMHWAGFCTTTSDEAKKETKRATLEQNRASLFAARLCSDPTNTQTVWNTLGRRFVAKMTTCKGDRGRFDQLSSCNQHAGPCTIITTLR